MKGKCEHGEHMHTPFWLFDARGIEVAKVCSACIVEVQKQYRDDIFTDANYWHDEDIDED